MADYNTFIVVDCNTRKPILTTSSARKASKLLATGFRVEVWNNNEIVEKIYAQDRKPLTPYIHTEREYIRKKQAAAELRNKRRKEKLRCG
jgi:hypothetical protein